MNRFFKRAKFDKSNNVSRQARFELLVYQKRARVRGLMDLEEAFAAIIRSVSKRGPRVRQVSRKGLVC